ncbi:unnamed protein product [Durusdinium trenchii]|uniref:EF-hand domain-containing protein n=1 Tax=Durusdinium trenchii TaxID=1381693 RepID=A0ABP0P4S0_9DINO
MEWLPRGCPAERLKEALQLSETEDGLMRKCCRRALDLFTAEGNVQGQLNQDRVHTLLKLLFDQGDTALHDPKTALSLIGGSPTGVGLEDMVKLLLHPHFRPQDRGRFFVALSLAEGETLRRILHCKLLLGPPLAPANTSIGLRALASGFSVLDRSVGFEEGATYQTLRAMQLCRYFDTQVFFKDEELTALLRGLQHETPFARRRFFEQIGGCRRRAVGDWAERPIAVALTVPSEFEIMVQRIRAVRLRETISGKGLGVQEAFERFDLQQVGFLGPIEICQALKHLGFQTSPDEILDWLEAMDESGDHVVSYREFFSFVKHKVDDAFMGGDHAIVTELGKEQLAHSSGPPALDRAISGTTGGDPGSSLAVPPALNRATSGASGGSGLTVGRPPSMKREISRKPELSQGERDSISNRLQDRIARRKLEEEKEKEHIAVEEEEMQIAIEEQHGANPLYTYANVTCQGATTADFDFQMDYLPKDCFAFGFVEPVTVEGSKGFLQVDKRSFVQCTKLQLAPNGGSSKKLNVYGLTMNFCCPSLPQSEPGGGAVSTVRVNIHYAIADVYFVYAGKEKSDQKAYTHEFKLEPGENITDVTVKSVEGVGAYSLVFKTTQGRTSETFEGDEMEYLDSDDLSRKNWAAGRGNMIAGLKTKVTDGVVSITGITKKPVNQSGKTEAPSDRLTLVSLSRAPGDADSYEQAVWAWAEVWGA